jgi:formyl-CoA transferase
VRVQHGPQGEEPGCVRVAGHPEGYELTAPETNHGPLTGLRVIELGMLVAGPHAARLLAEMGAEVIKLEAPDRLDPLREWGKARYQNRSLWWPVQSRNKKCATLDLRKKSGQELLLSLVKESDVVIENFRPGTLEKWNLGFDRLIQANPRIILCRVSGYGQTGPYSKRAGFASVAEAMGGLRFINGNIGEPPPRMHISLGDTLAGMVAVHGILAALYWRDALAGGRGQVVDVSLLESTIPEFDRLGIVREPGGTGLAGVAPSNIFRSRDGKWIVIAANADNIFRRLCGAMDMPELADDPRFSTHLARGENQKEIDALVATWAGEHDAAEIDDVLNRAGVVCGPIYSVADMFNDPHFWARGMLVRHEDPEIGEYIGPGIFPKFSETPSMVRWSAPWEPGSHNREIFGDLLGLSNEELDELKAEGVL